LHSFHSSQPNLIAMAAMLTRKCTFGAAVAPARATRVRVVTVQAQKKPQAPIVNKAQALLSPVAITAIANVMMAMPAHASGKLFDFGLTLPAMTAEFLLLMVFLDKTWFTPVGKHLDERDALIRSKLGEVKGNSNELERLAAEASDILRKARMEVAAMIATQKMSKQKELDAIYEDAKKRVTAESDAAIAAAEIESKSMLVKLDAQVDKISDEVLSRVLPKGVTV
jgi:F-type H+-transporting ATPase subunit b